MYNDHQGAEDIHSNGDKPLLTLRAVVFDSEREGSKERVRRSTEGTGQVLQYSSEGTGQVLQYEGTGQVLQYSIRFPLIARLTVE